MKKISVLLVVLLLAAFAGCGGPTIDGSSDQAFKESLDAVRASLDEKQAAEFDKAVMTIAFKNMGNLLTAPMAPEAMMTKIKDDLNGKNAEEVIELAAKATEQKTEEKTK